MLFRLTVGAADVPLLSWRIAKNPNGAEFRRELSSGDGDNAVLTGRYVGDATYEVVVRNSLTYFAQMLRKANESTYVTAIPYIVCPINLRGIATAFRSAMSGSNETGGTHPDDAVRAPTSASALVGPIPMASFLACAEPFAELGIEATVASTVAIVSDPSAAMIKLTAKNPMPLAEFLQKAYVVLYAVTRQYTLGGYVQQSQIDKIVRLSESWLRDATCRRFIVKRLAGHVKGLESKIEAALDATAPEREEGNAVDERVDRVDACDAVERRVSLHEQRHELISSIVMGLGLAGTSARVVDMGSSEGKLIERLSKTLVVDGSPKPTYFAVEGSDAKASRLRRKIGGIATVIRSNIVAVQDHERLVGCDLMVLSEVIEHLCAKDRALLIEQVRDLYRPKTAIITVPNIEANAELCRLAGREWSGEYRDRDHQTEFTKLSCLEEIVGPLGEAYDVEAIPLWPGAAEQPSFVLKATRRRKSDDDRLRREHELRMRRLWDGLYLPSVSHRVTPSEIADGMTSYPVMSNGPNIFWLGSSIAPCGWSQRAPSHLEHPHGAFEYFRSRGVRALVEQKKLMGCRASALAFRDPDVAAELGFEQLTVNARSGGQFFSLPERKSQFMSRLAKQLSEWLAGLEKDFAILDGEMMPWSAKEFHITGQFRVPGEAMALWRQECDPSGTDAALRFVRTVERFAARAELSFNPFAIPAIGRVERHRGRARFARSTVAIGAGTCPAEQYDVLASLEGLRGPATPVQCNVVTLDDQDDVEASIERWTQYTETDGGEGFVYKPRLPQPREVRGSMWPGVSAVKVRGADYLEIIYGPLYREPGFFAQLQKRQISPKRQLSVIEDQLADGLLRSFLAHDETEHARFVAAFLATDHIRGANIDRTL